MYSDKVVMCIFLMDDWVFCITTNDGLCALWLVVAVVILSWLQSLKIPPFASFLFIIQAPRDTSPFFLPYFPP